MRMVNNTNTTKTKRQIKCEEYADVIHKGTHGKIEIKIIKNPMGIKVYLINNETRKRYDAGGFSDFGAVYMFLKGIGFMLFAVLE